MAARAKGAAGTRPSARVEPVVDSLWGERIVDPYRWMEGGADAEWLPFMHGQATAARLELDALPNRRVLERRIAELSGDIAQSTYPRMAGGMTFYERREPGASSFKLVVRTAAGIDRIIIDPANFTHGSAPATLDWWMPSPQGDRVVFGISTGGSEAAVGHVVEVASAKLLDEKLADTPYGAPAWLPDGSAFFYNRFAGRPPGDPNYYSDRTSYLHLIGTNQSMDRRIVARDADPAVAMRTISSPEVQAGVDSDFVALVVSDGYVREFDLYLARRDGVTAGRPAWRRICLSRDGITDFALIGNDVFLLSTANATPRGAVLRLDARTGTLETASVIVPQRQIVIDQLNAAREGVYLTLSDGGEQSLALLKRDDRLAPVDLPFTGWIQSVAPSAGGATLVRITGWLEPPVIYAIRGETGGVERTQLQPAPIVDLTPFETRRSFATARDGTRIPISIVALKGAPTSRRSCLIHVYGAYGYAAQPTFDLRGMAFLEAGGMMATAHVRGGGEYGRPWHEAGQKQTKPNTWHDLVACAEQLVSEGYTAPGRIAILGGSAGGIAVGRAMTERPTLFGAVLSKVGMSNPLRAEFEPNGKPNVPEFGSVADRDGFLALKAMDSYHAVRDGVRYPALLLTTGINDARVAPHNAAKMAARVQAARADATALLSVNFEGGHELNGAPKASVDAEFADDFAFVFEHTKG